MIQSSFGFPMGNPDPKHRLLANDTAGGGILDVGCYPVSMARLIAGAAAGQAVPRPDQGRRRRAISARPASTSGRRRSCSSRTTSSPRSPAASRSRRTTCVRVFGTDRLDRGRSRRGSAPARQGGTAEIVIHRAGRQGRDDHGRRAALALHLRDRRGRRRHPRRQAGVRPARHELGRHARQHARARQVARGDRARIRHREGRARGTTTIDGRPLAKPAKPMRRRKLPGLAQRGVGHRARRREFRDLHPGRDPLDAFYERGGNVLDTAWLYGARPLRPAARRLDAGARRARGHRRHRQGRAFAAGLSRRHRAAAHRVARPAEDRLSSTSTSCTATIPTCRSASSSTRWTPR